MSLLWTINRLRSMNSAEVLHRLIEKSKKISAKNRLEGWSRYSLPGKVPVLPGIRGYVSSLDSKSKKAITFAAERILDGRFSAFGAPWPQQDHNDLFPSHLWTLDPITGLPWPGDQQYCFDISYRNDDEHGDIKYLWELNRLQFLQPLAAYAFLTNDRNAARTVEAAIHSWCEANPPFQGLNWASGIEVALRSVSLLIVASLLSDQLSDESVAWIRTLLSASFFWLKRYPSLFSSANNHLIAELSGEFVISLAMGEIPNATHHVERARTALAAETKKQFYSDGVAAEQSPSYGAFSAEFLWLCNLCGKLPPSAFDRLTLFSTFVHWLADESGNVPSIGDNDGGRVLCFAPSKDNYALEIARRIGVPTERHGMKVFREGGYTVVRGPRWHVVFDHGPLGYLSIAAHGHADALSVWISVDGIPLIVDPGTYLYNSKDAERNWFRGTLAHNTLCISGTNQSDISGPFNWSRKANCTLEAAVAECPWSVTASHDGYVERFGVRHRRRIRGDGDQIIIEDELLGGACEAELVFQLAHDVLASVDGHVCEVVMRDGRRAFLQFDPEGHLVLEEGQVCPGFGLRMSAPRLTWKGQIGGRQVLTRLSCC